MDYSIIIENEILNIDFIENSRKIYYNNNKLKFYISPKFTNYLKIGKN